MAVKPMTPLRRIWRRTYAFFYNKYIGLLLILLMAVLALLGTLIIQAPDNVLADPVSYQQFLAEVRPRYGGWTGVLSFLGMFDMYASPPFVAVTVLLALSIVACTTHRIPLLWMRATRPKVHATEAFFERARTKYDAYVTLPPDEALPALQARLRKLRYRFVDDPRGPGLNVYADKNRWGPFGTALAHAAFVIILLGMLVSANTGYDDMLYIAPGESAEVGHGTGLTVRVDGFSDTYNPDGSPADYVSEVVLLKDGEQVQAADVRVNSPLRYQSTRFHQATFGIAADVTITSSDGTVLHNGAVPLQWQSTDGVVEIGWVRMPEIGYDIMVAAPASGAMGAASGMVPGQVEFFTYLSGSDQPLEMVRVTHGNSATLTGFTVAFHRETKYTGLNVVKDPGAGWVWVGSTLLIVGMAMTFGFRHRRMWIRVLPAEGGALIKAATADKRDAIHDRWFHTFFAEIDEGAPTPSSTSQKVSDHAR